jgi:hypothetical protein
MMTLPQARLWVSSVGLSLALVLPAEAQGRQGWHLLVPPVKPGQPSQAELDGDAPLSRWLQMSTHDTAEGCERARLELSRSFFSKVQQVAPYARCVALDDPGLKP